MKRAMEELSLNRILKKKSPTGKMRGAFSALQSKRAKRSRAVGLSLRKVSLGPHWRIAEPFSDMDERQKSEGET